MKQLFSLFVVCSLALSISPAQADSSKAKTSVKAATLKEVNVCPMTGESSKGSSLAMNYKTYKVHFCCPGCDTSFAKLSPQEKDKKIADALKVQKSGKA